MKITLKTTQYATFEGKEVCEGKIMAGKEVVGVRRGWSGMWDVENFVTGEKKHFNTEKGIREWFAKSEPKQKEMSLKEYVAQHGRSFIIEKKHVETAEEKELKAYVAQHGRSFKIAK